MIKKVLKADTYTVPTPPGDKKDISCQLPKSYSPQYTEAAWYEWWEKQGLFNPDYRTTQGIKDGSHRERFVICLPPPNVTGSLHLGHALGNTIQDAIVRWHRMHGHEVLWNPGCDHAGIATQVVVEKKIWREQKKTRHDLGREQFVQEVCDWKNQKGVEIYDQMRRLGSSLDWSRAVFTLDQKLSRAVTEAFIRLHDEGLIYRSKKMVNWSCDLKSTISDIEVDHHQLEGRSGIEVPGYNEPVMFGVMTYFAYPVEGGGDEIVVATTRPETMLGDTGIAVHPDDNRYKHLHGKYVTHPLCEGRRLPIVCDTCVDMELGTGAVKITPSHDPTDYEVGLKHGLDFIDIMDNSGHMNDSVGKEFTGLPRLTARTAVVTALKEQGLFRKEVDHPMTVPVCSRSKDIIEPRLKDQWFVDCRDMADKAIQAVETGQLKLIPTQYEKPWFDWLEKSREQDWCISRQLWWGHRVPAYRVVNQMDEDVWVSAHSEQEAVQKAAVRLGVVPDTGGIKVTQDEDVLDTWFSSALFPFSIFGWPDQTADLARFYPTSLLETASDIMFFWVARMVMMGQKLTGKLPFNEVLFHSILRDAQGRKMSKSRGNVIDPMDVINGISLKHLHRSLDQSNLDPVEIKLAKQGQKKNFPQGIPRCGADSFRFTLASCSNKAHYTNIDVNSIKSSRLFCNKIWQTFNFVTAVNGEDFQPFTPDQIQLSHVASRTDLWILSSLSTLVQLCDKSFRNYDLNRATEAIYTFWMNQFCAVYLEYSKIILYDEDIPLEQKQTTKQILFTCLDTGLRSLSPFMPFITEELYQRLHKGEVESICLAPYPCVGQYPWTDSVIDDQMQRVQQAAEIVLLIRTYFNLTKSRPTALIITEDLDMQYAIARHRIAFQALGRSQAVTFGSPDSEVPDHCYSIDVDDTTKIGLKLQDEVDVATAKPLLQKKREICVGELRDAESKCSSSGTEMDTLNEKNVKAKLLNLERIDKALDVLDQLNR